MGRMGIEEEEAAALKDEKPLTSVSCLTGRHCVVVHLVTLSLLVHLMSRFKPNRRPNRIWHQAGYVSEAAIFFPTLDPSSFTTFKDSVGVTSDS